MGGRRSDLKILFFDSSVLFTAVNSPVGGSAKLFMLDGVKLVTSTYVLTEVERNVRKKLLGFHIERFFKLVGQMEIIEKSVDDETLSEARSVIAEKDAYILAQVRLADSIECLITLDRKDFMKKEVRRFIAPKKILTPREFLQALV